MTPVIALAAVTSFAPAAPVPPIVEDNAVEVRVLAGHTAVVCMAVFSPDRKTLASVSEDGTVKIWDWRAGKLLNTLRGHAGGVIHADYSPDGKTLATSSRDKTVILWDPIKGVKRHTLADHTAGVNAGLYSPDGKTLATASDDSLVLVRDAAGKVLHKLQGHKRQVIALAYSPDGKTLISAGGAWGDAVKSGELKAWDLATGKERWSAPGDFAGVWGVSTGRSASATLTPARRDAS
jgi:WD40 repeat protein